MNKALYATILIVSLLSGCVSVRLIDNQVSSFVPKPVHPGATYRFERLPSQQADATAYDPLEAMTAQALARRGLRQVDQSAELVALVQLIERVERPVVAPVAFGWRRGWLGHHGGAGLGNVPLFPGLGERPNYWREVRLTLREPATQAVVFESSASHDGPWRDSAVVVPAMLDAALQGFPNPPPGLRRVGIEIPR
ncbi:MAG: DUF4136 domain-containing protein [Comamonadaceae bacterium]|nr:DUF4136 domain-containing protein [Comamonadaceae bacterium]